MRTRTWRVHRANVSCVAHKAFITLTKERRSEGFPRVHDSEMTRQLLWGNKEVKLWGRSGPVDAEVVLL